MEKTGKKWGQLLLYENFKSYPKKCKFILKHLNISRQLKIFMQTAQTRQKLNNSCTLLIFYEDRLFSTLFAQSLIVHSPLTKYLSGQHVQ